MQEMARGLVANWMMLQVDARGSMAQWLAGGVGVLSLLIVVVSGGFWRFLFLLVMLAAFSMAIGIWLIKRFAMFLIRRFAQPKSLAGYQTEIDLALNRADLPTDPLSIVRFLLRLRNGPGAEANRVKDVVTDLFEAFDREPEIQSRLAADDIPSDGDAELDVEE